MLVLGSLRRYYSRKLAHVDVHAVLQMETHLFDSGISYHVAEGIVRSSINFKTYRADASLRDDDAFWDILRSPEISECHSQQQRIVLWFLSYSIGISFLRYVPRI